MKFFRYLFICLLGIFITSYSLFCSTKAYRHSFNSLTIYDTEDFKKPQKSNSLESSQNPLHQKKSFVRDANNIEENNTFLEKLFSKESKKNTDDYLDAFSDDSFNNIDTTSSDTEENNDVSMYFLTKEFPKYIHLSEDSLDREKKLSIKDEDFKGLSPKKNPHVHYINLDSGDLSKQIDFEDKAQVYSLSGPFFFDRQQNQQLEICSILKDENYVSGFSSLQIAYIKFVGHLFKIRHFTEIEEQFVKPELERYSPSTEDDMEKKKLLWLEEEIKIDLLSLDQTLSEAPKFLEETKEILTNSLCFIPIKHEVYDFFIDKSGKSAYSWMSTQPHTPILPTYLKFPSHIHFDMGVRFYLIDKAPYMTLKESNIQKCDEFLQKWNHPKITELTRQECFKIIYLSNLLNIKAFLENDEFEEKLRRSIGKW